MSHPSASAFVLHPRLADDCHVLGRVAEGLVLLHKNASLPWFLLVPDTDVTGLHYLPEDERRAVQNRWNALARWVHARFACDRVNMAAIGNVVSQLHLHTIGRRQDDPLWPDVAWGNELPDSAWCADDLAGFRAALRDAIGLVM